jgi:hypothetical protein
MYVAVQHGDIAVSDNPFRLFGKMGEVEPIDDAYSSVTTTATKYCTDIGVVKQSLHQAGTMGVASSQLSFALVKTLRNNYLQSPRFEHSDGGSHLVGTYGPGGCCQRHSVACMQVRYRFHNAFHNAPAAVLLCDGCRCLISSVIYGFKHPFEKNVQKTEKVSEKR